MFLFFFFLRHLKIFTVNILVALGLHCCVRAFFSCGAWGLLFVAVGGLLVTDSACSLQQLQRMSLVALQRVRSS